MLAKLRLWRRENRSLRAEVAHLRSEGSKLKSLLEGARRAAKRQAAPFSKGPPEPSAKAGAEGWRGVRRKGLPPAALQNR